MTESEARQAVLLQAAETGGDTPLWTAEDAAWATRLARESLPAGAAPERFVAERARHAMQRLLPRDAAGRRWLASRAWRPAWAFAAAAAAFGLGLAIDHIGSAQRINLLAPPVWAVVAWNLAVYLSLLLPVPASGLRRALARRWLAGRDAAAALWARAALPLTLARAALLLHAAAAALALGLAAGMYLRGLVLDYRAGWQSTFLTGPAVQAIVSTGLAPAAAATGIAVPDVAPLRVTPDGAGGGPAAPWIHLYAATLALLVVGPRALLAGWAAWRARRLARRFPLALDAPYFQRLALQQQGSAARVQVLPHAAPPGAQAAIGLQRLLAAALGPEVQLQIAAAVAPGDEDRPAPPPAGTTLRLALFDLAATPEDDSQGRLLAALKGALPLLAVADEAAFVQRFGHLPQRLAERRDAWRRFAQQQGVALLVADLTRPDAAAAQAALQAAFVP